MEMLHLEMMLHGAGRVGRVAGRDTLHGTGRLPGQRQDRPIDDRLRGRRQGESLAAERGYRHQSKALGHVRHGWQVVGTLGHVLELFVLLEKGKS